MSITKIHLFSKKTDAVESMRGYEYQKLKTLEAWLANAINKTEEDIYCEYEEDIFHRDVTSQSSKFRQIKLYSTNFSFTSEEIKKAIVHFFSLYTKSDYLFENVVFLFESNSDVSRKYEGNDADLLRSWVEQQEKLEDKLSGALVTRTKAIVEEYYNTEYAKLAAAGGVTPEIDEAYGLFKKMKDDDWLNFVKCIRWKFDGLSVDEAVASINENIKRLILALPYTIEKDRQSSIMGTLYREVSDRTIQSIPSERKLTNELLEKLVLQEGSEEDKWYITVYGWWINVETVNYFSMGEFYEVLDAAQHCRRNKEVWAHLEKWKTLLQQYSVLADAPLGFKRKALYELVWLNLKADRGTFIPEGSLQNIDDRLRLYFTQMTDFRSSADLEDALNLINIVNGTSTLGITSFTSDEVLLVIEEYINIVNEELTKTTDENRKCKLLENLGFARLTLRKRLPAQKIEDILSPLNEIIPLLPEAPLYNVSQLGRRINEMLQLFIRFGFSKHEDLIETLDKFSEVLEPHIQSRDGKFKSAKLNIQKGVSFIQSREKNGLLKGLHYFHKAKDLYFAEETMEGYVLAVLNIAQFYSAIGLHFAAKYYALTALWASISNGKPVFLKRIPQCFAMLQHIDFKAGAWFNAIDNFTDYVRTKTEFDNSPIDPDSDKSIFKVFSEVSFMVHAMPEFTPALATYVESLKTNWGELWSENFPELMAVIEQGANSRQRLEEIIENKIDDQPLNDLGGIRVVQWNALGTLWQVQFDNTSTSNSVAEEFCALFQIFLGEISLLDVDFHLLKSKIKIHIEIGSNFHEPKHVGSNAEPEYEIELPELITNDVSEVNLHNRKIGQSLLFILSEISLLKFEELSKSFEDLFHKQDLAGKSYTLNTFQKMFRDFYSKKINSDKRQTYKQPEVKLNLPHQVAALMWKGTTSEKYSREKALERIATRQENTSRVAHLTIAKLKDDPEFKKVIEKYRKGGWLDWQIGMAIMNFIVDRKCKLKLGSDLTDMNPEKLKRVPEIMREFVMMDEKDCYIEFSAADFNSKELESQFSSVPSLTMKMWDLESRARKPNSIAIREFLNKRFQFDIDDVKEGNILNGI